MPRVKNSVASRRRRKKVLKLTKGFWGAKSKLYRVAHEAMMKSLSYAYRDRRVKREILEIYGLPELVLLREIKAYLITSLLEV